MKKTFITLLALAGVAAAVDTVQIDFGRYDSQTNAEGFYNIHTAENFVKGNGNYNYVNGGTSATTTHSLALGDQQISLTFTHSLVDSGSSPTNYAGGGLVPTLSSSEENGWKNPFSATLPGTVSGNVFDGLTTQTSNSTGQYVLSFSGLAAGTYSLTAFGGFYGNDGYQAVTASLGDGKVADWNSQSLSGGSTTWSDSTLTSSVNTISFAKDDTDNCNHGYYFDVQNIIVGEDGLLELTISGSGTTRLPLNYVALSAVSLDAVPEPATATLSLLALAGLAMRRRRK